MIESYLEGIGFRNPRIRPIGKDNKNQVWLLNAGGHKHVVKRFVHTIYGGYDPLTFELFARDHFPDYGLPCPAITYVDTKNRITIKDFIEGTHPRTLDDYQPVLNYLRKLHAVRPPHFLFHRSPEDLLEGAETIGRFKGVAVPQGLMRNLERYRDELRSLDLVLGHGDSNPDNFIIKKKAAMGVDFDFLSRTTPHLDLAILITHSGMDRAGALAIATEYFGTTKNDPLHLLDAALFQYNLIMLGIYYRELKEDTAPKEKIKRLLPAHFNACHLNLSEDTEIREVSAWIPKP